MKGHGCKLGRKKEVTIAALLTERNHAEAARVAGIDLSTLKRWLRLPEFKLAYLRARQDIMRETNARIQQNSGVAVAVLLKLVGDATTPSAVRARIALGILEQGNGSLKTEDLETRIAAIEAAVKNEE